MAMPFDKAQRQAFGKVHLTISEAKLRDIAQLKTIKSIPVSGACPYSGEQGSEFRFPGYIKLILCHDIFSSAALLVALISINGVPAYRTRGALVQRIDLGHVLGRDLEVVQLGVRHDTRRVGRLRERNEAEMERIRVSFSACTKFSGRGDIPALERPADENLSDVLAVLQQRVRSLRYFRMKPENMPSSPPPAKPGCQTDHG